MAAPMASHQRGFSDLSRRMVNQAISTHQRNRRTCTEIGGLKEREAERARRQARRQPGRGGRPEVARHEAADDDRDGLRDDREDAQADEREAKESEADVLNERRERGIGDKAPVEMARIGEELQLVAMETVAAVGEQMEERDGGSDADDGKTVAGRVALACSAMLIAGDCGHMKSATIASSNELTFALGSGSRFMAAAATRTEAIPAAVAAWMPSSVSSKTRQSWARRRASAARRNAVGRGFAVLVVFGADEGIEFVEKPSAVSEPTTESRRLPETTAKGMRPCCASICSSTSGIPLSSGAARGKGLFACGELSTGI